MIEGKCKGLGVPIDLEKVSEKQLGLIAEKFGLDNPFVKCVKQEYFILSRYIIRKKNGKNPMVGLINKRE